MAFINRYNETIRGCITFTGNTIGLSKATNQNNQGLEGSIGAFTSLNSALSVGDFPSGTTLNISDNGSSAQLVIPPGANILYAELVWGGNYFGQDGNNGNQVDISALINDPVQLTTSLGTNTINQDPITAQEHTQSFNIGTAPQDFILSFYERSQNVTNLISPLGSGTHTISVEEIPGLTAPVDNETTRTNHAGWTLGVVYEGDTLPYRNLNIWAGSELISTVNPDIDIVVSGFTTPPTGTFDARLLISAQEGDAILGGDQLLFGPTVANLNALSGPNNPISNFFGSQINDDNGNLDTTGTFGNRNQNAFSETNIPGGRQGWDITNVDASPDMVNNQTTATIRLTTVGDAYMPDLIGLQIDVQSPIITIVKSVDKTQALKGENLLYTLVINNSGTIATNNFNLLDTAPVGTSIDLGTINIINATGPTVDSSTNQELDIELGPVAVGQSVTVQFEVTTDNNTTSPIENNATSIFEFTTGVGQPPIQDNATSNTVVTTLAQVTQTKSVSDNEALVGDIVTYTITIDNTLSNTDIVNINVFDDLQVGTSYVASSTSINGGSKIDSNPSISPGVFIPSILGGQVATVSFDVSIDVFPGINPILNTGEITFSVGNTTDTQLTNETQVLVLEPNIDVVKSVDKPLAQVGEALIYTSRITNTGDIDLQNIIFNDPPPVNTTFDPNTVMIDSNPYPGVDPNLAIDFLSIPIIPNIFPLANGEFVDISYQVIVDVLPDPPEINNISTVNYEILVDSTLRELNEDSNEVKTDIYEINVVKEVDKSIAEGSDILKYTSTITTTIPGNYNTPIIFNDIIPNQTNLVPGSINVVGTTFTDNSTTSEVIIDLGNIFPPNDIVITFEVVIDNNALGSIINTSQITVENIQTESNEVITNIVDPQVSKQVSKLNALVGDTITYTITIDNSSGQSPITNVFILDNLQIGTSYINSSTIIGINPPINADPTIAPGIPVGVVSAGQVQIVTFDVSIDEFPNPNPILNTANISYQVDGNIKELDTNTTSVLVQEPDIDIIKSVDKVFSQVGETLIYTSTITNTGTINIDNIIFNDPEPINTTYDGNGVIIQGTNNPGLDPNNPIDIQAINPGLFPLIPGNSITISYGAIISNLPSPPEIINTSSVEYIFTVDNNQQTKTEDSNTVMTIVYELDIIKNVDKTIAKGLDNLTYTFTISSDIDANILVPINFIDNIPLQTTFVIGSINVEGVSNYIDNSTPNQVNLDLGTVIPSNDIIITFDVLIDENATGTIVNISQLEVAEIITPSNDVETEIVIVSVDKNVSQGEAEVGEVITYTVTIDNSQSSASIEDVYIFDNLQIGTSYIPNTTVIDGNLPIDSNPSVLPGINILSIAQNDVVEVSFNVSIDEFPVPNPILNTADVSYKIDNQTNQIITNETEVLVPNPDIIVVKSVDKSLAKVGDKLLYTVNIENNGTIDIENLIFIDPDPESTVYDLEGVVIEGTLYPGLNPNIPIDIGLIDSNLFPLSVGETIELSFGVIITDISNPPVIENIATVDYIYIINGEERQKEESDLAQTRVYSLDIQKSSDRNSVEVGDTVIFTSIISSDISGNIGSNIIFRDLIPDKTTFVGGSIVVEGVGSFINNSTPNEIILDLGVNMPIDGITIHFEVIVNEDAVGTILNTSTVETNGVGIDSNEVEINIIILQVEKLVSDQEVEVGEIITYTVIIDNSQSSDMLENVYLYDNLQEGTSYVANTTIINGALPIDSNPSILPGINIGSISANSIIEVYFDASIDILPSPNPVLNTADIIYEIDSQENSKVTNETQVLVIDSDINIVKSVDRPLAKVGDTLIYTINIENTGNLEIENLIFTDLDPANTIYDLNGVTIGGNLYPTLNPNSSIDLGIIDPSLFPMNIGDIITISFGVIITSLPNDSIVNNIAVADYIYLVDGEERQKTETDNAQTRVIDLNIEKLSNRNNVEVGDKVTFTSIISSDISGNIGSNIIFRDLIPDKTTFVGGSIVVEGVGSFINNSTPNEIILDLGVNMPIDGITIHFEVIVNEDAVGTILNTSTVETNGVGIDSNEVEINIIILQVEKLVSDQEVEVGEIITYTVVIDNSQSTSPIESVFIFDELQIETSYVSNTTVIDGNLPIDSNPSIYPGIDIGIVEAENITVVSFEALVNSLPDPNFIDNIANINYVLENNNEIKETNKTQVIVYEPIISLQKQVSEEYIQVGERLEYTTNILNQGNIEIDKIIFIDSEPINTLYDGLGVSINGVNYPLLSPNIPIDIGLANPAILPLLPGESIEVTFGVIVSSLPSPPKIENISNITYEYKIDNDIKTKTQESNEVITNVINLELIKSVDPKVAKRLDIVKFTTTIHPNIFGNINNQIIFKDELSSDLELILNSIEVVGIAGFIALSTSNEVLIDLGNIIPANEITISFDAKILENAQSPIKNISLVSIRDIDTESNEVNLDLVILNTSKGVNDDVVELGDIINYSIIIDNTLSTADVTDVFVLDLLQEGTKYVENSTSINGGVVQNINPSIPPGIEVGTVLKASASVITFDAIVNEITNENPILNTATVSYNVQDTQNTQNTNETQVNIVDIDINKSVDKEFAQVGDLLTYTSVIMNTGKVDIENIIFNDPPPGNTVYTDNTFKINGVIYKTLTPNIPIDISLVAPSLFPLKDRESISIEFSVEIVTLPEIPIIENISSINYEYMDDDTSKYNSKDSNIVNTIIREGKLELEKIVDKDVAIVGDIINYTIKVANIGNVEVENVILTDILPIDTEFVEESVVINGVKDYIANPKEGINLGTINAPLTYIVSFDAKIVSLPTSQEVINNASVVYEVFVNPTENPIIKSDISNDVVTIIKLLSINISKSCNPSCVAIGDEIVFEFDIVNSGTINIENIKLFDIIPRETTYIDGSFIGANQVVTKDDLISGVDIGDLDMNSNKKVSFKVKLDKIICGSNLKNKADITYDYRLSEQSMYYSSNSVSNECMLSIKKTSFKQSSINKILDIPAVKPNIENIIDVEAKFICTNYKIIDTPIGVSAQGQTLTGKKLVVNGKLCVTVTYVALVETQTVHTAHFELCLSEYIVIPNNEFLECAINPYLEIEYTSFEKINERQLFINIVYILESGV